VGRFGLVRLGGWVKEPVQTGLMLMGMVSAAADFEMDPMHATSVFKTPDGCF